MQLPTNEMEGNTEVNKTGPAFDNNGEQQYISSDEDSEKSSDLSESFSMNNEKRNAALKNNQSIRKKELNGKQGEQSKTTVVSEGDTSDDGDSVMEGTKRKKPQKVHNSKKRTVDNGNKTEDSGANLQQSTNAEERTTADDSGVFVSGRLSNENRSQMAKSPTKPPAKGADPKNKPKKVRINAVESHARKASSSGSDSSDDTSWTTDGSSGGTNGEERTTVQKGIGVNAVKGKKPDLKPKLKGKENVTVEPKTLTNGQMRNSKKVLAKEGKDSSESSDDDDEEDVTVDRNASSNTCRNSSGGVKEGATAGGNDSRNITKTTSAKRANDKSLKGINGAKELNSKVESDEDGSSDDNENIESAAEKRIKESTLKTSTNNEVKSRKVVDDNSSSVSSDTSFASVKKSTKTAPSRSTKSDNDSKKLEIISAKLTHGFREPDHGLKKNETVSRTNLSNARDKDAPSSESDDDSSCTGSSAKSNAKKSPLGNAQSEINRKNAADDGNLSDSDDSESCSKRCEKPFTQISGKDKSNINTNIAGTSDEESSDNTSATAKKPLTQHLANTKKGHSKDRAVELAANSDDERSNSSSTSASKPFTQLPAKSSAKSQHEFDNVARDSGDDSESTLCIGTKSFTNENGRSSNPRSKNRYQSPPPNEIGEFFEALHENKI